MRRRRRQSRTLASASYPARSPSVVLEGRSPPDFPSPTVLDGRRARPTARVAVGVLDGRTCARPPVVAGGPSRTPTLPPARRVVLTSQESQDVHREPDSVTSTRSSAVTSRASRPVRADDMKISHSLCACASDVLLIGAGRLRRRSHDRRVSFWMYLMRA